ncbi:MAG: hypothetical protein M1814_002290 [Vezdaea aestivalis]|nr:MAG: hypothetical protein M1814_002290 [Vezdaea aestivalis]
MAIPSDGRGEAVIAVTTTVIAIATIFVVLRLVSRLGIVRRFAWDDFFMVVAWLLAFGLSFAICYGTSRGLGLTDKDIPPEWDKSLKRSEYAFSVLYNPALMATKTSILAFYLTLNSATNKVFRNLSIATLVVVNLAGLSLTILNIFQCRPFSAVFARYPPPSAKCVDIIGLYLGSAPVNIITDLAILFLPMPILTGMRLPKKQKTILVFTFALGGFVAVVDVVRIYYLQNAALQRLRNLRNKTAQTDKVDFSYYASLSFMWSAVEVNVGIICACIPTIKPLVTKLMPRFIHDSDDLATTPGNSFALHFPVQEHSHPVEKLPPQSSPSASNGNNKDSGDMGLMDFLTTPDTDPAALMARVQSRAATAQSDSTDTAGFFDFVDMSGSKPMVLFSNRESYVPIACVTILFFLWGFAYGLLDVLNAQFQLVIQLSTSQSKALHGAYYAGYFIAPLTFGRWILKRFGFKATFITGLCIYGTGTLIFWPSAVLTSFPAFLISNLIVGMGLATLEIAANPFIALCGPAQYAELRLNIAQAIQATGTVVSPILARKALFRKVLDAPSLVDVQWTYLGIALFVVLLAVAFYYMPLPEAPDEALEAVRQQNQAINNRRVGPAAVIFMTLGIGVFSQFCYVAAQEALSVGFDKYLAAIGTSRSISAPDWQACWHGLFAAGRYLGALANLFIAPRWILLVCYLGTVLFSALTMRLSGGAGLASLLLVFFFEGAIFPTIFAITLRGLGRHTKTGSAFLTAAISGGAILPPIAQAISERWDVRRAVGLVLAFMAAGTLYPIYLNVVPAARAQVDNVKLPAKEKLKLRSDQERQKRRIRPLSLGKGLRKTGGATVQHVERAEAVEGGGV